MKPANKETYISGFKSTELNELAHVDIVKEQIRAIDSDLEKINKLIRLGNKLANLKANLNEDSENANFNTKKLTWTPQIIANGLENDPEFKVVIEQEQKLNAQITIVVDRYEQVESNVRKVIDIRRNLELQKEQLLLSIKDVKITAEHFEAVIDKDDQALIEDKLQLLRSFKLQLDKLNAKKFKNPEKAAKNKAKIKELNQQIILLRAQLSPQLVEDLYANLNSETYDDLVGDKMDAANSKVLAGMILSLGLISDKISAIGLQIQLKQTKTLKVYNKLLVSYNIGKTKHTDSIKAYKKAKAANEAETKATQDLIFALVSTAAITTGTHFLATPIAALTVKTSKLISDITVSTAKKITTDGAKKIISALKEKSISIKENSPAYLENKIGAIIHGTFEDQLERLIEPTMLILQLRENLIAINNATKDKKEQWEKVPVTMNDEIKFIAGKVEQILTKIKKENFKTPDSNAVDALVKDTEFAFMAAWIKTNRDLIKPDDYSSETDTYKAIRTTIFPRFVSLGIVREGMTKASTCKIKPYYPWKKALAWADQYEPSENVWKKGLGL